MQGILAVLFAVAAYRLLPYWLLILFATWLSRLLPSAVLMYGLLASLAYQVLKHACGGLAICVAKLVIQGRHNFNEWLRLFMRCIRMRRSYLLTYVCQAADWQLLCSDAHNVFLARADVRSRCGLRNCLGYM